MTGLPIDEYLDDEESQCRFRLETKTHRDLSNSVPDVYRQACTETAFRANEPRPHPHGRSRTGHDLEDRPATL